MKSRRKLIITLILALGALFAYLNWTTYSDSAYSCRIKLPLLSFELGNGNVIEALRALRYADRETYKAVCANVKKISLGMACGGWSGGCYYPDEKRLVLSTANAGFVGWTAAILAHETCHAIQHKENREMSETECYRVSHEVLVRLVRTTDPRFAESKPALTAGAKFIRL